MTFVDTNVILDILSGDPEWADWSASAFMAAVGPRLIAPVVYAELAGRFEAAAALDREMAMLELVISNPTRAALFLAGRAHADYRRRGGSRDRVLPDFMIGAQAFDHGAALVTRDPRRYRTAFPTLALVSP